jgi:hypothetical protein
LKSPRSLSFFLGAAPFAALLSGCYAGVAGVVLGVISASSSSSGGGSVADAPPVVRDIRISPADSPDRILIEFRIDNEDSGRLAARVEFVTLIASEPQGPARAVTPVPGASLPDLGDLPSGKLASLLWDARADLGGGGASVQVIITPSEDGVEARSFSPQPFRAGNTQFAIQNLVLSQRGQLALATFDVFDRESDRVRLSGAAISVDRGAFHPVPLALLTTLRRDFPSAPDPPGAPAILSFLLSELDQPDAEDDLRRAGRPGFVGELTLELEFSGFPSEGLVVAESLPQPFDENEPPRVEVLQPSPEDLQGGMVPIRYRVFDLELNPADLRVEVDLGDRVFRPANEFPTAASGGRRGIAALGISAIGDPEQPAHTFLWDAVSQLSVSGGAVVRINASDAETGPASFPLGIPPLPLPGLTRAGASPVGEAPRAMLSGDFDGDGFPDAAVASKGTLTLFRGGRGGLSEEAGRKLEVTLAVECFNLTSGDYDGDGQLDLLLANRRLTVSYFHGEVDGPAFVRDLTFAGDPLSLTSADLDGDGKWDAVVGTSVRAASVTCFPGGPEGLVDGSRVDLLATTARPAELAAGDFNGDGVPDLAVTLRLPSSLTFLQGTGSRESLFKLPGLDLAVGTTPVDLATTDFDRDGRLDLVVANQSSNNVTYLIGDSTAGLKRLEPAEIPAGNGPRALASGDFTGDGSPDLVVANQTSDSISFLLGGEGGLSPAPERRQDLPAGDSPLALASGDFDGDGFLDAAAANSLSASVTWFRGGPEGLHRAPDLPAGSSPVALASGDYDLDGRPDLAVANNRDSTVTWIRGGARTLLAAGSVGTGSGRKPRALAAGDIDGDGFIDLAAANLTSKSVTLFRGGPEGLSEEEGRRVEATVGDTPVALAAGAFGPGDGPGGMELVAANRESNDLTVLGPAAGGLESKSTIRVGKGPLALAAGDFNGDGFLDVLAANSGSDSLSSIPGSPGGLIGPGSTIAAGEFLLDAATGDFDGDGLQEAVAAGADGRLYLLRGGPGGLTASITIEIDTSPSTLARADYDGDGFMDLAVLSQAFHALIQLRGGEGGLIRGAAPPFGTGLFPSSAASGDFDGDGFPDLVAAGSGEGLDFFRGGEAGLLRAGWIPASAGRKALAAEDLDGDGRLDLFVANESSEEIVWFRQRYFTPHANLFVDASSLDAPLELLDPRNPARYRLELPAGTFGEPAQVCLVPGPVFELPAPPGGESAARAAVTGFVTVLPEKAGTSKPAVLTLRLRDPSAPPEDSVLRVFRKDPESGRALDAGVSPASVRVVDFAGGKGIAFPITRFGSYVVVEGEKK